MFAQSKHSNAINQRRCFCIRWCCIHKQSHYLVTETKPSLTKYFCIKSILFSTWLTQKKPLIVTKANNQSNKRTKNKLQAEQSNVVKYFIATKKIDKWCNIFLSGVFIWCCCRRKRDQEFVIWKKRELLLIPFWKR